MTSNQGNLMMKTCWGREQLQLEMVKGKLQEEDKVNYHHPDPARQAGWQKPGRHVTNQVGTGSQKEVGCVYTPSRRGGPDPHETPGSQPGGPRPSDDGQLWFRGEARTSSRC